MYLIRQSILLITINRFKTGSGKTYTMGTSFDSSTFDDKMGIIPRAAYQIFSTMQERKKLARDAAKSEPTFEVCVQFIEV